MLEVLSFDVRDGEIYFGRGIVLAIQLRHNLRDDKRVANTINEIIDLCCCCGSIGGRTDNVVCD